MHNETTSTPRRVSAAHLTVPGKATPPTTAPSEPRLHNAARFERLKRLRDSIAPHVNKHDLAIALIAACIGEGIRSERDIVSTLYHLGLNAKHAGIMLRGEAGTNPALHRWTKGADGRYHLLG